MNKFYGCLIASLLLIWSINSKAELLCHSGGIDSVWLVGNKFLGSGEVPDYCWANGQELAYIRSHFQGLRERVNANSQGEFGPDIIVWTGDDAFFIVNNL